MCDVNYKQSLIVKGWRSVGSLPSISYQTLINEHSGSMGQGLCQSIEIIRGVEGGRGAGFG